ncbi:MAG: PKD domain-containing protein [Bacteroidales bacterium]|nr:PKD domain-containing protein [Bacteroidales bacterium]
MPFISPISPPPPPTSPYLHGHGLLETPPREFSTPQICGNPTHTYAPPVTTRLVLKPIPPTVVMTLPYQLTILPLPVADFVFEAACQGNPAQFNPSGMALGTIASWFWNFGDGNTSTLQAPSHIYTFAGTYSVTLSVTDTSGCSRSVTHPLTIVTPPVVNFDFNSPTAMIWRAVQRPVYRPCRVYRAMDLWDFGDSNTKQSITFPSALTSHTLPQSGTFKVSLWVKTSDSCSSLLSKLSPCCQNLRQTSTMALLALVLPFPFSPMLPSAIPPPASPPGTGILVIPPPATFNSTAPAEPHHILIPPELIP